MTIQSTAGSALTYLQSYLSQHTSSYNKSMDQLSSGNKNPNFGDNPVEVSKSAKFSVGISANNRASDNVNLGKDLLSTAETTQETIVSNVGRIRDLCVQAANGTYTASDKDAIILEIKSRLEYIDSTADTTKFNGIKLMDGSANALTLQIGTNSDAIMDVGDGLINVHTNAAGLDIALPAGTTGATWTTAAIGTYMDKLDAATTRLITASDTLGAYQNRLDFASDTLNSMNQNLTSAKSQVTDTDTAEVSANLVRYQVLQQASVSILAQANQIPAMALALLHR